MKEVVIHANTVNGHVNWLLGVVKSSSNLSKTNTSMLDCRDDVHWFILSNSEYSHQQVLPSHQGSSHLCPRYPCFFLPMMVERLELK